MSASNELFDEIQVHQDSALFDALHHGAVSPVHGEQYPTREAWLEARRQAITATDAPVILGVSRFASPFSLYAKKLGLVEDVAESEAMRWGLALEPLIAERYREETGRALLDPPAWTLYRSPLRPWQASSIDRVILPDPSTGHSGPGLLEIKTAGAHASDDWADGPPLAYQVQLQHELAVLGYQWGSLAVLIGGQKFLWTDVERDERFIERMTVAEAAFWTRLQAQEPPPVDGSDAARDAIAALHPREAPGLTVALPPEADTWDAIRQAACAEIERQTALKQEAENALKHLIGDAEVGTLPCGVSYSWRVQERKEYVVKASRTRVLRRKS